MTFKIIILAWIFLYSGT